MMRAAETFARRHAARREYAESVRTATEKFRAKAATAANPIYGRQYGLTAEPSEPLQDFLRDGAFTNFEMSRQKTSRSSARNRGIDDGDF